MNRERAEAIVEQRPYFVADAWDAAVSERPTHLEDAVLDWYRTTRLYQRHVDDLMDGTVAS